MDLEAADALFGDEPDSADHPDGKLRLKNVNGQLANWGKPKYDVTYIMETL